MIKDFFETLFHKQSFVFGYIITLFVVSLSAFCGPATAVEKKKPENVATATPAPKNCCSDVKQLQKKVQQSVIEVAKLKASVLSLKQENNVLIEKLKEKKDKDESSDNPNWNDRPVANSTSSALISVGGLTFASWAGVVLSCVAILVTVLGVIIAILAFWGFRNIKESAIDAAVENSESQLTEAINTGDFNAVIYTAVERYIYRGISNEDIPNEVFPSEDTEEDDE